ncbi:DUF2326 domain-containing protein [Coriobacterium glomerans]|uniref:DUF2326 domain-containing protein n=1 Tax=Coriobacterium glomerans TaxID=33871 RepID=UPI00031C293B|nr:DUF2326 domain-containing protein [Coriobacterium glomerans]
MLVYSPKTKEFPVSINELLGTSTGTKKSLIVAFDLACQQFARENGIRTPQFTVHGVVESVEGPGLKTIIDVANN